MLIMNRIFFILILLLTSHHAIYTNDSNKSNIDFENSKNYKLLDNYLLFGATFGTPTIININIGYHTKYFGVQLSGLYLIEIHGAQINVMGILQNSEHVLLGFSLIGGYTPLLSFKGGKTSFSPFVGGTANINLSIFYIEIGLAKHFDSYESYEMIRLKFQLGILFRLNREYKTGQQGGADK